MGVPTRLAQAIVSRSEAGDWEVAVMEWEVVGEQVDYERTMSCVCGQERLKRLFTIRNRANGNVIFPIGSTCILRFGRDDLGREVRIRIQLDRLVEGAVRLGKGGHVGLKSGLFSRALIEHLWERGAFSSDHRTAFGGHDDYLLLLAAFNRRGEMTDGEAGEVARVIEEDLYPWLRSYYREQFLNHGYTGGNQPPISTDFMRA